ncbi:MAG: hypothetical protein ABL931_23415 [Usitatibacteraceae bacterium]
MTDSKGFHLVHISGENEQVRRSILNLPTGGEAKALAKAIAMLPTLMDGKPAGEPPVSTEGREYMRHWVSDNLPWLAQRPNMDLAAMAARAKLSAGQRGLALDDLAPATVESIIKEAVERN